MSDLIEKLPSPLERNLASMLMPGEVLQVKIKGAFKEGLICTDSRVIIIKAGFMTGSTFGGEAFQQPYRNIAGVQIKFGMMNGYIEISAGGMQNSRKIYWATDKDSDPAKAPNCVSLTGKPMRDKFQRAATYILQMVDYVHGTTAPTQPVGTDHDAMLESLAKLGQLRDQGILTEEEFAAKKSQILGL